MPQLNTDNNVSILSKPKSEYQQFPTDTYIDAGIIAYHVADLPPRKYAVTNDPVPSVRFLFSGHPFEMEDDDGKKKTITIRKWTKWYRISYHKKAALVTTLFKGISDLEHFLTSDAMFITPFKIVVEHKSDPQYTEILRAKIDGQTPRDVSGLFYDASFVPYKTVKVFGNMVRLCQAKLKVQDAKTKATKIVTLHPSDMLEEQGQ